jgi:hypothetical protein
MTATPATLLIEAIASRVPGSSTGPIGGRLKGFVRREVVAHFSRLQSKMPMAEILALDHDVRDALGENAPTPGDVSNARRSTALLLEPVLADLRPKLADPLRRAVAEAYVQAANDVEQRMRRRFRITGAREAIVAGLEDLPIPDEVIGWARIHTATRVTGILSTTQAELANTIADAMTGPQRGVGAVATAIQQKFPPMSRNRAELIANTEMNDAMSAGALERGASLGATTKEWLTVGDSEVDDVICLPNEGQGEIKITGIFQSGHRRPPGHPRCRCAIVTSGATRATVRAGLSPEGRRSWLATVGVSAIGTAIATGRIARTVAQSGGP